MIVVTFDHFGNIYLASTHIVINIKIMVVVINVKWVSYLFRWLYVSAIYSIDYIVYTIVNNRKTTFYNYNLFRNLKCPQFQLAFCEIVDRRLSQFESIITIDFFSIRIWSPTVLSLLSDYYLFGDWTLHAWILAPNVYVI